LGSCELEPDVSGSWTLQLTPVPVADGGAQDTIPGPDTVTAQLRQVKPPGILSLGRLIYGTLTSADASFFDPIMIPELMNNGGSKTGALFGCEIAINVPVNPPTDNDTDPAGPLRIGLAGTITARGKMGSNGKRSTLILKTDMISREFSWTATQP
jgi:hypothetical protein